MVGTQIQENTGEIQNQVSQVYSQVYKDLLATVKKYVKLRYSDLKELSDIWLTVQNLIDTVKKTMGQAWYEEHKDNILSNLLEERADKLIVDLLADLRYWGLESLTFMELETISTIINDVIGYCVERGYGPDDLIDECLPTGDDA